MSAIEKAAVDTELLASQVEALLGGETDALANAANFVAALYDVLPATNWVGLYLLRDGELVLGPFVGKPACTRIPLERGVCGAAARTATTQRVADVHAFDGHIACDPASRSELVVPLTVQGKLLGVLDLDSPEPARFSAADEDAIVGLARLLEAALAQSGTESLGV